MKAGHKRLLRAFIIVISSIFMTMVVVILFLSPITKYLIEKYDVKYLGRQITVGWVYLNPFTGYIHLNDLKIYESADSGALKEADTLFFSVRGVSANFAMLKLLSKTIEITEITLNQPKGIIIQKDKDFNFNDLIKRFTPEKPNIKPSAVHFTILSIKIIDGEFYYHERLIPINYYISKVNLESKGKRWDADTIAATFSLLPGVGSGDLTGDFTINFKTKDYRYALIAHKFDLTIIEQYLKELTNYGSFSANLDANVKANGNLNDEEDLTMSGQVAINDFHFGKNKNDDYASFDKLALAIIEISPKNHKYLFDSVSLNHPYFKYERYDYLDNIQTMFGENGSNISAVSENAAKFNLVIEIARYVKVLAKNFFQSNYKINRMAIYKGNLKFNDFAISEKFSVDADPLYIIADSIDKNHQWVDVSFKSGIKPYGNAAISLKINPNDSTDFDLAYHIQKVPISVFNPYLITYTSYPVDRGTLELNGTWKVRKGQIQSVNHLVIIDPRAIRRLKNKGTKWIPLRWIMSLIRERGNVIDYEIPITGNLKNPKFHLHDVLVDLLENIFVKPATTSYRMEVRDMEEEIEKSLTLKWNVRQSALLNDQKKFVNQMADFLIRNTEASIAVYPMLYADKEKEYITFYEARKRFFLMTEHKDALLFSVDDSFKVDKMSVKDSLFVHYLNKHCNSELMFTIQEKCNEIIGSAFIDEKFRQLNKKRENSFLLNFKEKGVGNRVKVYPGENNIPYNGFSFYKIVYKGELPSSLIKAYREMNKLNNKAPRKKYKNDRKNSGSMF